MKNNYLLIIIIMVEYILKFIRYKHKAFISLLSLINLKRKIDYRVSRYQTIVKDNIYSISGKPHYTEKDEKGNYLPCTIKNNISIVAINGKIHNKKDIPAITSNDGHKEWWRYGKRHRDYLPAVHDSQISIWYQNGFIHRDERDKDGNLLPAFIVKGVASQWYQDGRLHRDEKNSEGRLLPAIIYQDGSVEYYKYGNLIA